MLCFCLICGESCESMCAFLIEISCIKPLSGALNECCWWIKLLADIMAAEVPNYETYCTDVCV